MSALWYNEIIIGEPFQILGWSRVAEFDKRGNYIRTLHKLRVRGAMNPQTISYAEPVGGAPPVATAGKSPMITDRAIRHQLSQARGKLKVLIGTAGAPVTMLESPAPGLTVDAANGPFPTVYDIVECLGLKTYLIDFEVTTYINEAGLYVPKASILLSNSFSASAHHDEDGFTTRVIRGTAIFRSDRLEQDGVVPDQLRAWLFTPIPAGFKRESIDVEEDEDNLTTRYVITDRQKAIAVEADGVSRIEALQTNGVSSLGLEEAGWRASIAGHEWVTNIALAEKADGHFALAKTVAGMARSTVHLADQLRSLIPRVSLSFAIRVWGQPHSKRSKLQEVAMRVILHRLNLMQLSLAGTSLFVTQDLLGKFVEVQCTVRCGPGMSVGTIALQAGKGGLPDFAFPEQEDVPGILNSNPDAVSPAPPGDGVSRGSYLGRLVVAGLLGQNAVPPRPVDPPAADAKTPP